MWQVDGPCLENQLVVAESEGLELISKILDHTPLGPLGANVLTKREYDEKNKEWVLKPNRFNGKIDVLKKATFLLTSLLEGPPNKVMEERILKATKWGVVHDRLQELWAMRPDAKRKARCAQNKFDLLQCKIVNIVTSGLNSHKILWLAGEQVN